jgi:hypothetical protein
MENEKILEKIKKLFELSKNNPSEEEAKSAALKAQELLAQYHIEYAEVENVDLDKAEPIGEVSIDTPAKKWKYTLAHIVADNFRTKHYWHGKEQVVFFGHKTDVMIAAETYIYLFEMGNQLANKLCREAKKLRGYADNVYNSCVMGFCAGIREALAEQSVALMVVVPEDVKDEYRAISTNFRTFHTSAPRAYNGDAFNQGRTAGYNAMRRNALEG